MIIYFSANHRTLNKNLPVYRTIVEAIQKNGSSLASSWLEAAVIRNERTDSEIPWKDIFYESQIGIQNATAAVVEASGASAFGNGYEVAYALAYGKPTLVLIAESEVRDSYASGLSHEALTIRKYQPENIEAIVKEFILSLRRSR